MLDRQIDTRLLLFKTEAELLRLRGTLSAENRLSGPVKHDLANALMLVMAFRELLGEPAPDDLIDDADQAVDRALRLAEACVH